VVLTGDVHSYFVNDVRSSNRDPGSPVVATELVGTSISSGAWAAAQARSGSIGR
jgi:phosphodiesterase/alkaline phosphatase D-like protein